MSLNGFERIVAAVDGSESSLKACKAAASVAKGFNSEVTLVEVIPSGGLSTKTQGDEFKSRVEKGMKTHLEKAASLLKSEGIEAKMEILYAHPSVVQSIVDYGVEKRTDMIVLGTRGLSGLQKMFLGSVSSGVATHAKSSVLIVRTRSPTDELTFRRILVAVDGSENSSRAAVAAAKLSKTTGGELTILHIVHIPSYVYDTGSVAAIETIEKDEREYGEKLLSSMTSLLGKEGVNAKKEMIEEIQSPALRITKYAENNGNDLIVIGARGVHGFERLLVGSVATGVLNYSPCSILVIR